MWRSAGGLSQDLLEVELLAVGLLSRERDAQGRESVLVTDSGVALLAQTVQENRATRSEHEALVARVAREMQRTGRVVWCALSLRARVGEAAAAPGSAARRSRYSSGPNEPSACVIGTQGQRAPTWRCMSGASTPAPRPAPARS